MRERSESVEIFDLTLVHSTEKAYLVYQGEKTAPQYWIPKSQVEDIVFGEEFENKDGRQCKKISSMTIPEWLAEDKELDY